MQIFGLLASAGIFIMYFCLKYTYALRANSYSRQPSSREVWSFSFDDHPNRRSFVPIKYMLGRNQIFRFTGFAMLLFCNSLASAKDMPRYGIFVYSNFCTSAMSGDLYGNRITLRRLIDGDTLIYEYTDGSTHVVVADNLKLDPKSGKVGFEVHAEGNLNTIVSGQFSGDGGSLTVQGMLFNEMATVTLKLISDFAAPIQNCKE